MNAELHALRLVCPTLHVRAFAALVVDRDNQPIFRFDQVDAGDQAQPLRREGDRPGMQPLEFLFVGGRQRPADAIHPAVGMPPLHRISRIRPLSLHPFQVCQARTVGVFVHHSCRHQRRIVTGSRKCQLALPRRNHFVSRCSAVANQLRPGRRGAAVCCRFAHEVASSCRVYGAHVPLVLVSVAVGASLSIRTWLAGNENGNPRHHVECARGGAAGEDYERQAGSEQLGDGAVEDRRGGCVRGRGAARRGDGGDRRRHQRRIVARRRKCQLALSWRTHVCRCCAVTNRPGLLVGREVPVLVVLLIESAVRGG